MGRAAGCGESAGTGTSVSARAHGAGSKRGNPTKEGQARSKSALVTFALFESDPPGGGKVNQRHPLERIHLENSDRFSDLLTTLEWGTYPFPCRCVYRFRSYSGSLLSRATKVTKKALLLAWPSFVGSPHSGDAPWARAERTSMSWQRSRRIHAAWPTPRRLRSACTQVAFGGVWTCDV